jgi:signal transduction histidine kinase
VTTTELVERLAAHRTLGSAPRAELEWLASHGSLVQLKKGDVVSSKSAAVENLIIMLSGRVAIFVQRGVGRQRIMEWRAGDVTGMLPYSRLSNPPGDSFVQEDCELLAVHRDQFPELIHQCHDVTTLLVHSMLDRARAFTSSGLHDEKMVSLGKLSAGLAHELNNPASAIERSAALLVKRLEEAEQAARTLGATRLSEAQLAAVDALRTSCLATPVQGIRSPLQQADREEAIADWLDHHGLDMGLAESLAETAVTTHALERVAGAIDGSALHAALRSAAAGCAVRSIAAEIQEASMRISGLVIAIKGYTHMDQAVVAESMDLLPGLRNTVAVLRSKARDKSAAVSIEAEPDLPRVRGFAGELNQIWGNLIDNALDAIPDAGRIEIRANRDHDHVVVRIVDNGGGIPESIRQRIYDPFFTTKPMGHGTGMGLEIVRRLVLHNDGEITFESQPGRTEFRIALPIAQGDGSGDAA